VLGTKLTTVVLAATPVPVTVAPTRILPVVEVIVAVVEFDVVRVTTPVPVTSSCINSIGL